MWEPTRTLVMLRASATATDVTVTFRLRARQIPKSYVPRREKVPREALPQNYIPRREKATREARLKDYVPRRETVPREARLEYVPRRKMYRANIFAKRKCSTVCSVVYFTVFRMESRWVSNICKARAFPSWYVVILEEGCLPSWYCT